MAATSPQSDLLCSIISDIKTYNGSDPLLPWLRGIKKLKEWVPQSSIKEKLPRFLEKCAKSFESDSRYKNDLRYLRVWLQLMDYVEDPRPLLRSMEMNHIGTKRSLYYQAHALYYEKRKKFDEAEKMYHLGVQNLAEPVDELHKSYEQFLQRIERHKTKKMQRHGDRSCKRSLSAGKSEGHNENACSYRLGSNKTLDGNSHQRKALKDSNHIEETENVDHPMNKEHIRKLAPKDLTKQPNSEIVASDEPKRSYRDDSVVLKFVASDEPSSLIGNSGAEYTCHHGLLDPTINTKEAMNAINVMFREPLETAPVGRYQKSQPMTEHVPSNGLNILVNENLDDGIKASFQKEETSNSMVQVSRAQSSQQPFSIFIDDEESSENVDMIDENGNLEQSGSGLFVLNMNTFVFPCPKDVPPESSDNANEENSPRVKIREDTVVHRFVGSTILDEPEVENVCHHGLVDPTINLKEAMDDINHMFGKPMEFVRSRRRRQLDNEPSKKQDVGGFSILPDDDLEQQESQPMPRSFGAKDENLFEPTVCTKEAMDEINKLFGVPLDF